MGIRSSTFVIIVVAAALMSLTGCGQTAKPEINPPVKTNTVPPSDLANVSESEEFFQRGLKDYEQYNYKQAIANFDQAITANPANFKVYTAKGIALCFMGDYQGGMALIQKTLALKDDYVPAFYDMAMAYKLQNDYDQALYWFEKTIQGDPHNTWSYYGIATIYADRRQAQEALRYLQKAIELDQGVKAVAQEQDHFAHMRNMREFQALVR